MTETWLTPQILDNEFIDNRHIVHRCDRDRILTGKKEGGGVLVAVMKNLRSTFIPLDPPNTPHIGHVLIQLLGFECVISVDYIPPKSPDETYIFHYNYLHKTLERLNTHLFYSVWRFWLPNGYGDATVLHCNSDNSQTEYISNFMSLLNAGL